MRCVTSHILVGVVAAFAISSRADGDESLSVTLELSNQRVALGDCVIARVAVTNISERSITFDVPFALGAHGPTFEVLRPNRPAQQVFAIGQGAGSSTLSPSIIGPGQHLSCFAVFVDSESEEGERIQLAGIPGKCRLRAGVSVNGRTHWSEEQTYTVRSDVSLGWDRHEKLLRQLASQWVWPNPKSDEALGDLPDGSNMHILSELRKASERVLNRDDVHREKWIECKERYGDVVADYASETLAGILIGKKRYLEAIQEISSMKRKTDNAINIKQTAIQRLQNPKAVVPVQ
jgi:hypothetical protein